MSLALDAFHHLHRLSQPVPSPCGSYAILSLAKLSDDGAERVSELWRVPLDGNGEPQCEVRDDKGCGDASFDSEGNLYFLSKRATPVDDEQKVKQVWRRSLGGQEQVITNEPLGVVDYRIRGQSLVTFCPVMPGLSLQEQREAARDQDKSGPSGRKFSDMPVRYWSQWLAAHPRHLIASDLQGGGRRDLTPDVAEEFNNPMGLVWDMDSAGQQVVAVYATIGPDRIPDSSLLLIELASGETRELGRGDGRTHESVSFSPDGSQIAAVRHQRKAGEDGPLKLALYHCKTGGHTPLAMDWQGRPEVVAWHGDAALLVTTPERGQVPLYRIDTGNGIETGNAEVRRITAESAGGSHQSIRCVGDVAIGMRHCFHHPPELFRVALEPDATPTLLTSLSGLPSDMKVCAERLTCEGDGGTPIEYFVLRAGDDDKPRPTLLWIHGGPVSAWGDGWHWRWNPLPFVAAGFHIALPNPRGSTGYGQDFIEGIVNNEWGGACYRDLMAVTDALSARPDVDGDKIAAMGGSFGGYMSNWVGTQTERFAAIVTHASLYCLTAFHGTTDLPAYWGHHMGVLPDTNLEAFGKYSPHRFVGQWKTPVLITHGEKDYRVPISEALMLFEDLRRHQVDAELLIFPDENHWILQPRNSEQWYRECLLFLQSRLL